MRPVNNKILFDLLPDYEQPRKTVFSPDADTMKVARVISTGPEVTQDIKKDLKITFYVHGSRMLDSRTGVISDRDVVFVDDRPRPGKVHVTEQETKSMSSLGTARVISSGSKDISDREEIFYSPGQSLQLPDGTEIISETQIFLAR